MPQNGDEHEAEQRGRLLAEATEAAAKRDPRLMLACLHACGLLDGFRGKLLGSWGSRLSREDIDTIVADAVDAFYGKVSSGQIVDRPASFIFKAARNMAVDQYDRARRQSSTDPRVLDMREGRSTEDEDESERRTRLRREAIRIAKTLLPKLGSDNVQRVMGFFIEAVGVGDVDVSNERIAEALGVSRQNVAVWKSRGFDRLRRESRKLGFDDDYIDFEEHDPD